MKKLRKFLYNNQNIFLFLTQTTPGCGEAVVWTVFERSIGISAEQLEKFKSVRDSENHELTHNYRHIQPLNSRNLIYVQGRNQQNSGALSLNFSLLMIFAAFVAARNF